MSAPIVIKKNRTEEVRITIDEFKGHRLVNMRVWFTTDDGEKRPGKQGLALRLELLPDLRRALLKVQDYG